jgi:succinate dehydrogenase / fumarate reductase iron-sulfur subunit
MKLVVEIKRFNPEKDNKPYYQKFEIGAETTDRILDVLLKIKEKLDPALGFRKSCAHGVCGSDAMIINGKERLACKTLVKDIVEDEGNIIRIEPLRNLQVQKDLMVDQTRFFEQFRRVKPYFINPEQGLKKERLQTPEERKIFDDDTKCILCTACYSACPVIQKDNPDFIGPAAIVQAARFNDDSRDLGFEERLHQLDTPNGVWSCQSHFECTRVCPRSIKVTKLINLTKNKIRKYKAEHQG